MAPKSRSLPAVYAANSSQLQLPVRRSARSFIKRTGGRLRALEAEVRKLKDYSKSHNKAKEPQNKLKNKLREKLARRKSADQTNPTSSRSRDQDKYEIIITPTINKRIIYTHDKIEGKNGEPIKVAIYKNGQKDTSKRFASARLEILAISGDFCEKGEDNWTYEEFDDNVVSDREGMGPILAGPLVVDLVNGEATLDGLVFKDNTAWARKKMLRIGARVLKRFKVRVKEGITEPLRVKDHHCKAMEKPRVPKLKYRVMCLTGVGKTRISDLKKNKIRNVRDFLRQFYMDESQLLKIVGIKSKTHNSWKSMVEHAKKCKVGPCLYSYRVDNQNVLLFFSRVYELVGAEINGHYKHFNKLTVSKALVNKWKKEFYKKVKDLKLDFIMGQNGPIPLEFDSSETSLQPQLATEPIDLSAKDNDPNGVVQDGKSMENICSTSETCVDKTRDCENVPSKDNMVGSCIPNQEVSLTQEKPINLASEVSLPQEKLIDLATEEIDPVATVQDVSADNICSISETCVDKTKDCENIPSNLNMAGICMPNQEETPNMVPSASICADQDSVQGADSASCGESQVSSPESSQNNPPKIGSFFDPFDDAFYNFINSPVTYCSFRTDMFQPNILIGEPPNRIRQLRLRHLVVAVYWISKRAHSASQSG